MIQKFVDRFIGKKEETIAEFMAKSPEGYDYLFRKVVDILRDEEDYNTLDPERITVIDHGDYQGNRLFIVGEGGYQPSRYFAANVAYGSCSGCDAFEGIRSYDEKLTKEQATEMWTLCLHMVQNLKEI